MVLRQLKGRIHRFQQRVQQRVPVRLQLNATECGAACLAMILSYYGRQTQVSECREFIGVGRDGVTAEAIAQAARHYGLRVKAYSVQELQDFRHVPLPAIAHWNFKHFVVVERWTPRQITIVDPDSGRCRLTPVDFAAAFTGVVLTLEPGTQFTSQAPHLSLRWQDYLGHYLRQTPGLWIQILATSLLLQGLGLVLPVLTQLLIDRVLPLHLTHIMPILAIGMVIVLFMQLITSYLRGALLIYLQARIDLRMMLVFFEHLLTLPFRFFEQRTTGDLLMRLGSNAVIRETLTSQTLSMVLDSLFVLGYLLVLLLQSPLFGGIVLLLGLLQVGVIWGTTRSMHDLTQRDLWAQADSQGYLVEVLSGIQTLKACGAEDRAFDHWSTLFYKQLNVALQRNHLATIVDTVMLCLRTMSPLILLWLGTQAVFSGTMSLGMMLALNAIAAAFLMPLSSLVSNAQRLQLVGAHLDRLRDVWMALPEQKPQEGELAPPLTGQMELQQVSFRYSPQAPLVLHQISMTIQPRQTIALVGRSGSGKSTLAKLLLGLYVPTSGAILYDGIALTDLNWRSLRRQFGVVLQEPFLFSGSIRHNIAVNHPDLSLAQVQKAAQLALLHDEIMQLPMGYDTPVAEGGTGLSGGQRQRLAIARAIAHQPAILLLDEATSHLDGVTESWVERNLSQLACTRIVIAHRLSTIRNADLILVVDQGTIVEQGTHDQLLAQQGYYTALVQSSALHHSTAAHSIDDGISPI
ncbi:peptidase domain-containing ABC transporter [Alkalinema pantanalense CENA528]|uniref:peptidase domain-containing ABC transporter n=1 Tax=Alkalinema pantanalense TaxID=1620705 RepID=UPI003D6FF7B7